MKITVAIPTIAGRTTYLASCLRTCTSQDHDELEILVSDNSYGEAEELCRSLNDSRVRYIRPQKYRPMSSHWDFVLQHATGDSISIIGDDDGLMPGCVGHLHEIHREFGNVAVHHALANYHWPDSSDLSRRNCVVFHHPIGINAGWIETDAFSRGVANGTARYVDGPMIYHNFIPMALVRALSRDGVFFRRSSPDLYSALAIAANTQRFYSVDKLLTLSGQGARANGASARNDGVDGRRFLREMQEHVLYSPRFDSRTIQLQLVDALFEVAEEFSKPFLVANINFQNHLLLALREAHHIPGWGNKYREIRTIMGLALRQRVVKALTARLFSEGARHFSGASSAVAPRLDAPIYLGEQVRDIFQATVALDLIMKVDEQSIEIGRASGS